MATIRKHRERWQVQVRRKGYAPISRSFLKKSDAEEWARHIEIQVDRRLLPTDAKALDKITLRQILQRYIAEILPKKRAGEVERKLLDALMRRWSDKVDLPLSKLTPQHYGRYREERLETVKPATICRELGLLQHAYDIAQREWDIPITVNPLKRISKPKINNRRERRLSKEEAICLLVGISGCQNPLMKPLVMFAIETGMRRGEILNACWNDYNAEKKTLHIPETKNGEPRTIPLSPKAIEILSELNGEGEHAIFPLSLNAFVMAWKRLIKRTKIIDLHFHDLRHEAISRFVEKGLSVPEVALISGHKDYRMLLRYTHLRPEDVARKL
jgi:integrase